MWDDQGVCMSRQFPSRWFEEIAQRTVICWECCLEGDLTGDVERERKESNE
jgi:hypothetical protein